MIPIPTRWKQASRAECACHEAGRTCILVVEDDLLIGAAAAEALEDSGFVVLTAASAEEAEIILGQEMIDVLFTDIDLGGRDGCDLAHRALKAQPDLGHLYLGAFKKVSRRSHSRWSALSRQALSPAADDR